MTSNGSLEFEDRVELIVAARPVHFGGATVSIEMIAWAIKAIEDVGLHPSLKLIARSIGKQAPQRELLPLVNLFYRQRVEDLKRRDRATGVDHLAELYDVITAQVRAQIREELSEELDSAKEAWEQVAHARRSFEAEREAAARQLELAEAIRSEFRDELTAARTERIEANERAEQLATALGSSQREVRALCSQGIRHVRDVQELTIKLDRRESALNRLKRVNELSAQREAALAAELRANKTKLSEATSVIASLNRLVDSQKQVLSRKELDLASLSVRRNSASGELSRTRARLARCRVVSRFQRAQIEGQERQFKELSRRAWRLTKNLAAMSNARDRAQVIASDARADAGQSRLAVESLKRQLALKQRRET